MTAEAEGGRAAAMEAAIAAASAHIDENAPGGRYGYRLGHTLDGYQVPDVVLNSSNDRKVKVLSVGAGMSGILMSYLVQSHCENVELVVYEKNADIGGTWLENRYPGCACDVPSHAYTYAFALNADWPKYLSSSDDIFRYLTRVVDCFGLRKYITFNSVIQSCVWHEDEGKWHVKIADAKTGKVKEETCDILIGAHGLLNSWKWPEEVEGLRSFKGRLLHTARWPADYGAEQWKNERVAVLGSGASSVQTVPTMQPHVKHMDVFIRTPVWFTEMLGNVGDNLEYSKEERDNLNANVEDLVAKAKELEGQLNTAMGLKIMMTASAEANMIKYHFTSQMRAKITDDDVFGLLLPNFSVGCRRLTPGDPYMRAVQRSNVTLHKTAVVKVTPNSVIGANGDEVEVDTIICATGFDVSYRPKYFIQGRNGVLLQEKWKDQPEGYMSLAVPDMPNYFSLFGPNFPVANGSVMGPLQAVGAYIIQMIQKMQREKIHSFCPKQDVTDEFNNHCQAWVQGTTWADPTCRSWYKNNETGRVNSVWPGSSLHFCEMLAKPRFEDYDIKYSSSKNMFSFMGLGFTQGQMADNGDLSPYIQQANLEKRFYSFESKRLDDEVVAARVNSVNDVSKLLAGYGKEAHNEVPEMQI